MKKSLPYILIGVPLLIGTFLVIKYISGSKGKKEPSTPKPETTPETKGTTSGSTESSSDFPVRKGMRGNVVRTIQAKLTSLGFDPKGIDGIFGTNTYNAVVSFQKDRNVTGGADGIVGKNTWKSLFGAEYPCQGSGSPLTTPSGTPLGGLGKTSGLVTGGKGKAGGLFLGETI